MPIYEIEMNGRSFEVDAPNQTVAIHTAAAFSHATASPPAAATRGMLAPSGLTEQSEHDRNQAGMEYGLAGALPSDTPGPLAAASAVMLAAPVIAANPEAIPAAARGAAPVVKPVLKEVAKRTLQGAGAGAAMKLFGKYLD